MSQESVRQLFWTDNFKMPLPVHWFDGILNAGSYHTDSTNTWKNLGSAGSTFDAKRNKDQASTAGLWTSDAALFTDRTNIYQPFIVGNGSDAAFRCLGEESYTIGCTFAIEEGWRANYSGILGSHTNWNNSSAVGLNFGQYADGDFQFGILYNNSDSQRFDIKNGSQQFANGHPYNVIISMSPTRRAMYIDGKINQLYETYREPRKYIIRNNLFSIGSCYFSPSYYSTDRTFVGRVFDMYAWDRALTDIEVKEIANYSLKRFKQ